MFADAALALEIDLAEGRLCAEIAERAAARRPKARSMVKQLSGGIVAFAGAGSPTNKAIGVGIDRPLDEAALAAIESEWRDRREPMRIELASLAQVGITSMLSSRGYKLLGFENLLGRPLALVEDGAPVVGLTIEELSKTDEATWLDVTVDGFASPDGVPNERYPRDVLEDAISDIASTSGFIRYLARIDGEPAGAASLRRDGAIAQMCGAATLPAFRRRGIQTALLQHRLTDSRKAGCKLAVITTQPGSKSQENSQRRGFELLYTRAVLVREWS